MSQQEARLIVTGAWPDCSKVEIAEAWQFLVDNGSVWQMGKWYVDMATCLLSSGVVERNAA